MRRVLSPRELAEAIGVSESSLKRWADAGRIRVLRTEGGHRRIPIDEALRFIRDARQVVLRPDLLGFPELAGDDEPRSPTDALHHALVRGDARAARAAILSRFLAGEPVAVVCDGVILEALDRLAGPWSRPDEGLFVARRAADLCLQALAHVRATFEPSDGAPAAVGAAAAGDGDALGAFVAATVVASEGLETINLGADTPVGALDQAVAHHAPRLVWVVVSSPIAPGAAEELARFAARHAQAGRAVVVAGRHRDRVAATPGVARAASMQQLAAIAARVAAND